MEQRGAAGKRRILCYGDSLTWGWVPKSMGGVGTAYPAPQVLLVEPPPLAGMQHTWFAELFKGGLDKSAELAHHYEALATFLGIPFLNAGEVTSTGGVDGIHFTAENNEALGRALARKVEELALGGSAPAGPPTAS